MAKRKTVFTEDEKSLVEYLKEKLSVRGVKKLPRDWHLKQLSTARGMLAGENAPTVAQWQACMDWAFADEFWCDKVDHLARVEGLWAKYVLQQNKKLKGKTPEEIARKEKEKAFIRSLYIR
ncbi:MAG: hypothetical protein GX425_18570 [Peptococcaceae bacterium]|nr:hypothetical protein [Peptococcaceae bacterium]